ncbi:extensin-like domain-containing protein [Glacieibacterium megasporae]|uniref:extensin-like domain-containing protein n=1 Tax=Glacieibacterium megasporae TaxID=2835787 RepID=UPI001C1DF717|nr:extensin family protein [Polymorphobacter megasporae]UAJ09159.1 extensin family protein [Polymorphobacter megasporae]
MLAAVRLATVLVLAGFALFIAFDHARRYPQDLPWTPLDLTAPIGWATGGKLLALGKHPGQCRALLSAAGISATPLPDFDAGPGCRVTDAVRVANVGLPLDHSLVMTCPLAAAMTVWTRHVVIRSVRERGLTATGLADLGSLNCRRIAGTARLSEHAHANAVDIAAIRIGRDHPLSVARDFGSEGPRGATLAALHAGACRLFGTVLGPNYNRAHRDHFHLDMAAWNACR